MSTASLDMREERAGFARFVMVGGGGFVVDAGLLMLFIHVLDVNPYAARIGSILFAITATWALNRSWTFRSDDPRFFAEWARYLTVSCAGAAVNFVIYALLLAALPHTSPLAALAAGSAVALVCNFLGARFWAFRQVHTRRA